MTDFAAIVAKAKGYRTIAFNTAVVVVGAFYGQDAVHAVQAFGLTADQAADALVALVAAANVALRFFTNTAVGKAS